MIQDIECHGLKARNRTYLIEVSKFMLPLFITLPTFRNNNSIRTNTKMTFDMTLDLLLAY
jgi:hypothetical protein